MASLQMVADVEVYRSAPALIRVHSEDAALEAAQHADAWLDNGETGAYLVGSACWRL